VLCYITSYEDENKIDEALKAYENCLELVPYHEDAKNSIRYLENKIRAGGNSSAASKMASDPHAINPSAATSDVLLPGAITSLSDALMPGSEIFFLFFSNAAWFISNEVCVECSI
jgi:hypothetical protein